MITEESASVSLRGTRTAVLLVIGVFAVAAFAAYRNTLTAPFVLDDGGSITDNATIRDFRHSLHPPPGGYTMSGRPVFNVSLAVNYAISGDGEWSYHLLNLAIHFLAACVLFGLTRRTLALPCLRARFGKVQVRLAAAIAGLWLLHPLQTEAVTYVSQRTESLAGLFFLVMFYAFARSIESPHPRRWQSFAVVSCLLGMGTKEIMATAPVLLLLYDRTFVAGSIRRVWRERRGLHAAFILTWLPLAYLVAGTGWNRVEPWRHIWIRRRPLTRAILGHAVQGGRGLCAAIDLA